MTILNVRRYFTACERIWNISKHVFILIIFVFLTRECVCRLSMSRVFEWHILLRLSDTYLHQVWHISSFYKYMSSVFIWHLLGSEGRTENRIHFLSIFSRFLCTAGYTSGPRPPLVAKNARINHNDDIHNNIVCVLNKFTNTYSY